MISLIGDFSKDKTTRTFNAAKEAYEFFNQLSEEEKHQVSNKEDIPTWDEIIELQALLKKNGAMNKIRDEVLKKAVYELQAHLKNPSSYQERVDPTEGASGAVALFDDDNPERVYGTVKICYSATNSFGGRIDSIARASWEGTYIDEVFTLTSLKWK